MRILQAASEAFPFCKTGGLADVVGALSRQLGEAGHEVLLFVPRYRVIDPAILDGAQVLSVAAAPEGVSLRVVRHRSITAVFVECPRLFDREGLYWVDGRDHSDNGERFAVFSRVLLAGARALGFKPDIVHLHDWQAALAAVFLKADPFFAGVPSVLSLHNIAYQGAFPAQTFLEAGLSPQDFEGARVGENYSFLKAGLIHADWLTTVSPSYAREVQTAGCGMGLEDVLSRRHDRLEGILNGIDLEDWDPATDSFLPQRYSGDRMTGKSICKRELMAACGLQAEGDIPLVGMVARLDRQKGWDIAQEALESRLERCRFVGVGEGDPALVEATSQWAGRHPGQAHFFCGYNEEFAHRLYAACDMLLMPSRFEPCGLGQMIAMRYGCVPVVARTGGLADTVHEQGESPNGFTAKPDDAADFGRALDRAFTRHQEMTWKELMRIGMQADFSWAKSLERYLALYGRALREAR